MATYSTVEAAERAGLEPAYLARPVALRILARPSRRTGSPRPTCGGRCWSGPSRRAASRSRASSGASSTTSPGPVCSTGSRHRRPCASSTSPGTPGSRRSTATGRPPSSPTGCGAWCSGRPCSTAVDPSSGWATASCSGSATPDAAWSQPWRWPMGSSRRGCRPRTSAFTRDRCCSRTATTTGRR